MAVSPITVVRLSDLDHGQVAVCFAALVKKERGSDKYQKPYFKCTFRDKRVSVSSMIWANHPLHIVAEDWVEGHAFRLSVRGERHATFGMQVEIHEARHADDQDVEDGFDFADLFECTERSPDELYQSLLSLVEVGIDEPLLKRLILGILDDNAELLKKMPAAKNFHHAYNGGLLEHIWSMTRIATMLTKHYGVYYSQLNPPLNRGLVVAATILHDIGKLRELEYNPFEASYTTVGSLIGHIVLGRDMVRAAASKIKGFPEETLLGLEHAILSHHGRTEYGSPVVPSTIEALLLSHIDDLDAKMNQAAKALLKSAPGEFTERIYALDNRRLYRGKPLPNPDHDDAPDSTH